MVTQVIDVTEFKFEVSFDLQGCWRLQIAVLHVFKVARIEDGTLRNLRKLIDLNSVSVIC